jgi:hypothetical protein
MFFFFFQFGDITNFAIFPQFFKKLSLHQEKKIPKNPKFFWVQNQKLKLKLKN